MKLSAIFNSFLALGVIALVGCGGGTAPAPVPVATSDLTVNATAATTAALTGLTLTSAATGVPEFKTTTTTTLVVSGAAGAQKAVIQSAAGEKIEANLTYGSCIFDVTSSNLRSVRVGDKVIFNPCTITVGTKGLTANTTANGRVTWQGFNISVGIVIGLDGVVRYNDSPLGNVTLSNLTGA